MVVGMVSQFLDPASLPTIDVVDVILVDDEYEPSRASPTIPGIVLKKLTDDSAQQIARLWRLLPRGDQMRCHMPRYGLRFHLGTAVILEAAICFECNNIAMVTASGSAWAIFDAEAASSQELLSVMRSCDTGSGGSA